MRLIQREGAIERMALRDWPLLGLTGRWRFCAEADVDLVARR